MKTAKVLLTAFVCTIFIGAYAQQTNRGDVCQSIPGLTSDQQQKISNLGVTHQKKMDELRTQFRSESNAQEAAILKSQMSREMLSHYNNISALLTPEQHTWYDQACNPNGYCNFYTRSGYGRGYGRGKGFGRGAGQRQGTGNKAAYSQAAGYNAGAGYGQGAGSASGRGRRLCFQ